MQLYCVKSVDSPAHRMPPKKCSARDYVAQAVAVAKRLTKDRPPQIAVHGSVAADLARNIMIHEPVLRYGSIFAPPTTCCPMCRPPMCRYVPQPEGFQLPSHIPSMPPPMDSMSQLPSHIPYLPPFTEAELHESRKRWKEAKSTETRGPEHRHKQKKNRA